MLCAIITPWRPAWTRWSAVVDFLYARGEGLERAPGGSDRMSSFVEEAGSDLLKTRALRPEPPGTKTASP